MYVPVRECGVPAAPPARRGAAPRAVDVHRGEAEGAGAEEPRRGAVAVRQEARRRGADGPLLHRVLRVRLPPAQPRPCRSFKRGGGGERPCRAARRCRARGAARRWAGGGAAGAVAVHVVPQARGPASLGAQATGPALVAKHLHRPPRNPQPADSNVFQRFPDVFQRFPMSSNVFPTSSQCLPDVSPTFPRLDSDVFRACRFLNVSPCQASAPRAGSLLAENRRDPFQRFSDVFPTFFRRFSGFWGSGACRRSDVFPTFSRRFSDVFPTLQVLVLGVPPIPK
eukprot:gene547-biopygen3877